MFIASASRLITKTRPLLLLFLLGITLFTLLWQAKQPAWNRHLETDVFIHFTQANQYQTSGSWENIRTKEYQPGALFFFLLPNLFNKSAALNHYQSATLLINILLIIAHLFIYKRFGNSFSPFLFLLLLLAMGPILLFRFDLLVTLLVLLAWIFLAHSRFALSGIILGFSIATKLYPLILIPVMAAVFFKKRQLKKTLIFLLFILVGLALIIGPFLALGGSLTGIKESFDNQAVWPIGLESLWANAITATRYFSQHSLPPINGSHSIQGIQPSAISSPRLLYNYFWLFPVIIFTLFIIRTKPNNYLSFLIPLILLTAFILSFKTIAPQYLWWPLSFLPLINFRHCRKTSPLLIITIALVALILTQYIYPLYYSQFIRFYLGEQGYAFTFFVLLERNLLLIVLLFLFSSALFNKNKLPISSNTPIH